MGWKLVLLDMLPYQANFPTGVKNNNANSVPLHNIPLTTGAHVKHPITRHKGSPALRRKGSLR